MKELLKKWNLVKNWLAIELPRVVLLKQISL